MLWVIFAVLDADLRLHSDGGGSTTFILHLLPLFSFSKAAKIEAKGGSDSAIQFLAKHGDTALAMDMLPIINKNVAISESEAYTGQKPSLSACLELLPVLKEMVESRCVALHIASGDVAVVVLRASYDGGATQFPFADFYVGGQGWGGF